MARPLFHGNVIAVIWDFDQTLISGYQQEPLFRHFSVSPREFWDEVSGLADYYRKQDIDVSVDTLYLNHILTYVQEGRFAGLTRAMLADFGSQLTFYPGMPDFLEQSKAAIESDTRNHDHSITVEHYIVSTGLRPLMKGSAVSPHVTDIWGCDFIESPAGSGFLTVPAAPLAAPPVISQVGYFLDNTTKTRAIWEINKGCNKDPEIGVNDLIAEDDRRVPLRNMIYVADGPSDVPVFSILNTFGGRTLGVHNGSDDHYEQVAKLGSQGRVQHFTEADYRPNKEAYRWIMKQLREIAALIVQDRERLRAEHVQPAAKHVT
jgi:hypothetical protein